MNYCNANLAGYDFSNRDFTDSRFDEANCVGVNFSNSNLSRAAFSGADLTGAKFTGANLNETNFFAAHLENADFSNSDISSCIGIFDISLYKKISNGVWKKAKEDQIGGWIFQLEGDMLAELGCDKVCLEVGTFYGLSAYCTSIYAKSLVCVDTFKVEGGGQNQTIDFTTLETFKHNLTKMANKNITYFIGTSEDASKQVPGEFDFIFIDAMHDYANVKKDIELWLPRLKQGGIMAFHDYASGWQGVRKAVDECFSKPAGIAHSLAWFIKGE